MLYLPGLFLYSALVSIAVDCAGDSVGQRRVVECCLMKDCNGILISVLLRWQKIYFIFTNR